MVLAPSKQTKRNEKQMITEAKYQMLISIAGADRNWGGRFAKDSAIVEGITIWLTREFGAICAFCGEGAGEETMVLAHIIAATGTDGKRRGYVIGNLALCHASCNADDNKRFVDIPLATIARPDLVPTSGPSNSEFKKLGLDARRARMAEIADRQMRRSHKRGIAQ